MNARTLILGLASAVTTFLVTGAVTIELLSGLYGASPGVGILGVGVGGAVGLFTGVVVAFAFSRDRLSGGPAAVLVAYGAFGVVFLAISGLRYVNVPGADELFTLPVHLLLSLVVAVTVATLVGRRPRATRAS
ncbi:permease [Halobium salinum]|uniref:Permease n=1 Tax=Halobium salinum TaxID=1364940 RepID=A0ABD5P8C4_9EURY|nr:permease [Halobium salinum]